MLILSYNTLSVALDITGLGANFGLFDEMGANPLFEGSIRLNGFFFVLLYILSGANVFLITYNRNGVTSKIIAYLVASILLLILIFALIFVL